MMQKRLPFYYLTTLWAAAVVAIFFIIEPLATSTTGKTDRSNNSDLINGRDDSVNRGQGLNNSMEAGKDKEQRADAINDNDLIFYDKTAFIRYFSDTFSEEELTESYNKALAEKAYATSKAPIRVVRKGATAKTRKSFSGSFDIRPVPGN